MLANDSDWVDSGFGALEDYIVSYLGGTGSRSSDAFRLKLNTPIGVALALMEVTGRQLNEEFERATGQVSKLSFVVLFFFSN